MQRQRAKNGTNFLRECLQEFIDNKDMQYMAIENRSGAVTVAREVQEREQTHAIGFDIGSSSEDYDE